MFLPQSGETVWLRNHYPNERVEWWSASVPISRDGGILEAQVRNLQFDIQLPVEQFRELIPTLSSHGVDLYLLAHPLPDTLTLVGVPEAEQAAILKRNGLVAYFHLPHAHEVAWLASPSRETIERWLEHTTLSDWLQEVAA